jgi:hypothetical protein
MQVAVFVGITELVKEGKRMMLDLEWLQPLDSRRRGRGETLQPPALDLALEERGRAADREHVAAVWILRRVGTDELPDQVVESGSEVMKTVARDGAQLCWAFWEMEDEVAKTPGRVFGEDNSALDGGELLVDRPKRAQVVVRPRELRGRAGQRAIYGTWHRPISPHEPLRQTRSSLAPELDRKPR